MKRKIRLRNYIAFIYTLFVCIGIFILSITVNAFSGKLFSEYVKRTIEREINEIIRSFADQYQHSNGIFNMDGINAIGMHYLHRGYLISLEAPSGITLWDVHIMNMPQCNLIVEEITARMQNDHRLDGSFIKTQYTLEIETGQIGNVNIEVYAPFFYSLEDAHFIKSLNMLFLITGIIFAVLSVIISFYLAIVIAKPIVQTKNAARRISEGNFATRIENNFFLAELYELAGSVNDLAVNLENGEKWQKRLTSDMAHELRTPLTVLQGNIDAMIDGVWEPTPKRLQFCNDEIERLHKLIENLSILSLIERDNLNLHKTDFDLKKLLLQAAAQFIPLAQEKGITLTVNIAETPIHADYDRLMQVFVNLLSNAIKYTEQGNIILTLNESEAAHEIRITDTGIGIPENDLSHIFKRLYRSDVSRDRSSGGSGIGLSIVAAIVKAHGGNISVVSNEGQGSVFTVTLPKYS